MRNVVGFGAASAMAHCGIGSAADQGRLQVSKERPLACLSMRIINLDVGQGCSRGAISAVI